MLANDESEYTAYVVGRFDRWRRTAYLLCQDWHHADDVLQTTLTRLYLNWRRARAAANTDAYVHTILVRVFLADRRRAWARSVSLVAERLTRPLSTTMTRGSPSRRRCGGCRPANAPRSCSGSNATCRWWNRPQSVWGAQRGR